RRVGGARGGRAGRRGIGRGAERRSACARRRGSAGDRGRRGGRSPRSRGPRGPAARGGRRGGGGGPPGAGHRPGRSRARRGRGGRGGRGVGGLGVAALGFLWPQAAGGFGGKISVGSVSDAQSTIDKAMPFYNAAAQCYIQPYPKADIPKAMKVAAYTPPIIAG